VKHRVGRFISEGSEVVKHLVCPITLQSLQSFGSVREHFLPDDSFAIQHICDYVELRGGSPTQNSNAFHASLVVSMKSGFMSSLGRQALKPATRS
jgi:hypothetical protein